MQMGIPFSQFHRSIPFPLHWHIPYKTQVRGYQKYTAVRAGMQGVLKMLHLWGDSGYKLSIDKSPVYSIIYINKCADGKKYHTIPTVQRAAVWCKAVSVSCGKSSRSSLPNGCKTLVSSAGCSRYRAGLCWKPVRGCAQHANESGTAESLMLQGLCLLKKAGDKGFFFFKSSPRGNG